MKIAKSIILPIFDKVENFEETTNILKKLTEAIRDHNLVNFDDETELHDAEPRLFSDKVKRELSESWEHNWETLPSEGLKPEDNADVTGLSDFVTVTYPTDQTDLQTQIDGKIISWFQDEDPNTWSVGDRPKHDGDMWYSSSTHLLKRYKADTNEWTLIEDQKAIDAYADAATAQDTADGKRRVFVAEPTTPYDIGDLWAAGSSGDIKKCKTARASGDYVAGDWELASKYDNTGENTAADIINLPATPDGAGLYADATHLGYHDGSTWKAYIDNTGKFYFKGGESGLIQWDGVTLDIEGNIKVGGFETEQEIYFKDSQLYMFDSYGGANQREIAIRLTSSNIKLFRFVCAPGGADIAFVMKNILDPDTQTMLECAPYGLNSGMTELSCVYGGYKTKLYMISSGTINRNYFIWDSGQIGLPNLSSDPTENLAAGQLAVVNNVLRIHNGTSWSNV
ncbi:hypothetical protein ES708_09089 [subsurface metagenome]